MRKAVLILFGVLCFYPALGENIEVDLSSYQPNNKTHNVFMKFVKLSEDKTKIKITHINDDVGFFIIQVHSYIENLTLSYNTTVSVHSHVTGTNIGLIYGYTDSTAKFYIYRNIKFDGEAPILLVITLYDAFDPVPGGCNLSFNTELAPYQIVSYNDDYIRVDSQAPSGYGTNCADNRIQVDMYHMFLNQYDNDVTRYFDGVISMLTVDSIKLHGRKVPQTMDGTYKYSRWYSSYRGTGEIFAIVATHNGRSSAYVPAVSYGCDLTNWDENCVGPVAQHWKFMCATMLIFGLFICFLGHKLFGFTLYVIGFTFGVIVTYLTVSFIENYPTDDKATTSLVVGFLYGLIWMYIWWKFGLPLLTVQLNFVLAAILIASVVFYAGLSNISIYTNNFYYWSTFVCIVLACLIMWTPATMHSHIFCCSLLGSYAFIIATNYYLGGHLQYIAINTYRRATVKFFRFAVIDPPFQVVDLIQSLFWIFLVAFGFYVQLRNQKGKPPFPPHRNGTRSGRAIPSERTPLIHPENVATPIMTHVPNFPM